MAATSWHRTLLAAFGPTVWGTLSGCTPTDTHDGLALRPSDASFQNHEARAPDAAEPGPDCRQPAAFATFARPPLQADCVRCHDGSKTRATRELNLSTLAGSDLSSQEVACSSALLNVDSIELDRSAIFTSVDPSDPTTEHEFKYPSVADFAAYRAAIMKWLETE